LFYKELGEVLSFLKGSLAVLVIRLDGKVITLVQESKQIEDPTFVRGELAIMLKVASSAIEDLKMGVLEEVFLATAAYRILIQMVDKEHALILFTDSTANLGLARKSMKSLIPVLGEKISQRKDEDSEQ